MTRHDQQPTRGESSTGAAADTPETSQDREDEDDGFVAASDGLRRRLFRRDFLSDSAKLGGGALALSSVGSGVAAAQADGQTETETEQTEGGQVDQPEGLSVEVLAPHATFTDDVGMALGVTFEQGGDEAAFVRDPSTVVFARVALEPGGTTGWHTHPGPVVVNLVEGELDVVFAHTCTTHSYAAGEAFVDPGGHAEIAMNPSDTARAMAYVLFLGVPDGESPTTHVEPQDC